MIVDDNASRTIQIKPEYLPYLVHLIVENNDDGTMRVYHSIEINLTKEDWDRFYKGDLMVFMAQSERALTRLPIPANSTICQKARSITVSQSRPIDL